jgi:protease I
MRMRRGFPLLAILALAGSLSARPAPGPAGYPAPLLAGKRIALLADDHFQIEEAIYALFRLRESGAEVKVVGHHKPFAVRDTYLLPTDLTIREALAIAWDGVYVLGGFSPLELREDPEAVEIVVRCHRRGGLVAAICHGVTLLVPTGILKGRHVTGNEAREVEFTNAGGIWESTAPQIDGNLVTAISSGDDGPMLDAVVHWFRGGPDGARAHLMDQYLAGKKVAILLDARFSFNQYLFPLKRLFHNGAEVRVVAETKAPLDERRKVGPCLPDLTFEEAAKTDFDAILLTGDWAADTYRRKPAALELISRLLKKGRIVAAIAEGQTALISARACAGYAFAVTPGGRADIANAGGIPKIEPVVRDRNLLSCAREEDMGALMRDLVAALCEKR